MAGLLWKLFRAFSGQEPIDRLVQELENQEGLRSLHELRRRLGPAGQRLNLSHEALGSRSKTFRVYAAGAPGEQGNSIVVKFNPVGKKDPYLDDVYKDYRILTKIRPLRIAPEPLFCSSGAEEEVVGTAFIVMSFIEGRIFRTVRDIPSDGVIALYLVIMKKLAEVHGTAWGDRKLSVMHDNTQSFWQEVVDEAKANYRSIVGFWKWWFWFFADPESKLFTLISGGRKPINKERIGIVHGNLDIGNFIFNPELTEVRAILNWKYEQNGDALIDVASLLLAFLDIGSYGVSIRQRIVYPATDQEVDEVVTEYCQHAKNVFSAEDLEFAKAVCCLKMIYVVKRGVYDNFAGHELGRFPEITDNPDIVINLLWKHAKESYREFSL